MSTFNLSAMRIGLGLIIVSTAQIADALPPEAGKPIQGSTVTTFHSIGLYWTPPSPPAGNVVKIRYAKLTDSDWKNGHDMWYDSRDTSTASTTYGRRPEARGSIVQLDTGTQYIVQFGMPPTTVGGSVTWTAEIRPVTWSEIGQTIPLGGYGVVEGATRITTLPANPIIENFFNNPSKGRRASALKMDNSGAPGAWTVYDYTGTGLVAQRPNADGSDADGGYGNFPVVISGSYMILRGLEIRGGRSGIFIEPGSHDILIEKNNIWEYSQTAGATFFLGNVSGTTTTYPAAIQEDAGIHLPHPDFGDASTTRHLIIQRNQIHNPLFGANPWEFGHPFGATAILLYPNGGNNVIRYNETFSTADGTPAGQPLWGRFHEDGLVMGGQNNSYGGIGPDTDIYMNLVMGYMDDGVEIDGGGTNTRVWNNYFDYGGTAVSATPCALGPCYIWRNVFNRERVRYDVNTTWGTNDRDKLGVTKIGGDGGLNGGRVYIYHNTALQYNASQTGVCGVPHAAPFCIGAATGITGAGPEPGSQNDMQNTKTRNNIFDTWRTDYGGINHTNVGPNNDFDYDQTGANTVGTITETHGISDANKTALGVSTTVASYQTGNGPAAGFSGKYRLQASSVGHATGPAAAKAETINNFNDMYTVAPFSGPDKGAHQDGTPDMVFGLAAAFAAPDLASASDTGVSNTDNITSVSTPTFTGFAASGSTVQIFDGTTLIGSGTATNGAYSITTSVLTNGVHNITAKVGNVQSPAVSVTIDTAAPSTAAVTAPANNSTVSGTTTTVTASTDAAGVFGVQFKLDGAPLLSEDTTSPYSITWDTTTAANGSHTLTVVARDTAGNSFTSAPITVTVSNGGTLTPPSTPDLDAASDSGTSNTDNITSVTTPKFTGTATAGTTVTIFSDGAQVGSGPVTSGTYNITLTTALTGGTHSITAKASNATNTSTASGALSVAIDVTGPAVAISAPANSATVSGTVAVNTTASDANGVVGVQFKLDGAALQTEDTASPYSVNWDTTSAANGSHTLTAVGRDVAGNIVTSAAVTVTVSNGTSGELNVSISPQNTVTLSNLAGEHFDVTVGASQALTSVKFYVTPVGTTPDVLKATVTSPPFTFSWVTTGELPGNYTLKVEASDGTSTRVETRPLTVLASTCEIYASSLSVAQGESIMLQGVCSGSKNVAEIQFLVDQVLQGSDPSSTYTATLDTSRLSVGTHVFTVTGKFTSPAGESSASRAINVTQPVLSVDLLPGAVVLYDEKITFTASINDARQVKQVDFYLDGAFKAGTIVAPYEFTWTPSGIADLGRHTVVVQATDASGNVISTRRDVLLTPRGCSVQIGSSRYREAGADTVYAGPHKVARGQRISLRSECTAWESINRVEFYLNGTLQSTVAAAPYTWSLDTSALTVGQTYSVSTKGYLTTGAVSNDAMMIDIVAP